MAGMLHGISGSSVQEGEACLHTRGSAGGARISQVTRDGFDRDLDQWDLKAVCLNKQAHRGGTHGRYCSCGNLMLRFDPIPDGLWHFSAGP